MKRDDRSPERDAAMIGAGVVLGAVAGFALTRGLDWARRSSSEPSGSSPPARTSSVRPRPVAEVWTGPVNVAQVGVAGVAVADDLVVLGEDEALAGDVAGVFTTAGPGALGMPRWFVGCTGDGSPSCAQIAESWRDAEGRYVPGLRKALKLPAGPIVARAFSAGGHIWRRVLAHPRDRAEFAVVHLADATYTTEWADKKAGKAAPIEPFVAFAREAGPAGRLFVATASSTPNKEHPSGAQTLAAIADAAGAKRVTGAPGWSYRVGSPIPAAWTLPGVYLLDYGPSFTHAEHATKLAGLVSGGLIQPFLKGDLK